jgi:hypothetical protein
MGLQNIMKNLRVAHPSVSHWNSVRRDPSLCPLWKIMDVYDELKTRRSYKKAVGVFDMLIIIKKTNGQPI